MISVIGLKKLWEKEKLLVTSIFSFSHNVYKGLFTKVIKSRDCVKCFHKAFSLGFAKIVGLFHKELSVENCPWLHCTGRCACQLSRPRKCVHDGHSFIANYTQVLVKWIGIPTCHMTISCLRCNCRCFFLCLFKVLVKESNEINW